LANWRFYSNTAVADTLAVSGGGNLSTGATSIYAASGAPAGYPVSYPWILRLEPGTSNEELVQVNSGAGTSGSPWIITRAADGTTAKTHTAGTPIAHGMSAFDLTNAASHQASGSGSGVHGLPAAAWLAGAFATIAETSPANGSTSVSGGAWSGIPATWKHLLIVCQGRLAETSVQSDDCSVQFNGDSSSVYSYLTMYAANPGGVMTGPATGNGFSVGQAPLFRLLASQSGAAVNMGGGFAVIPNYASSAANKVFYSVSGGGNGTSSFADLRVRVGIWNPAAQAAITAISLTFPTGGVNNCQASLYGFG
jgi:hypothetical protein